MSQPHARPRFAKGPRPALMQSPDAQRLLPMLLASMAEISALYDRVDTLERLVLRSHAMDEGDLGEIFGDDAAKADREAWRKGFIERAMRVFEADLDAATVMEQADYDRLMEELGR